MDFSKIIGNILHNELSDGRVYVIKVKITDRDILLHLSDLLNFSNRVVDYYDDAGHIDLEISKNGKIEVYDISSVDYIVDQYKLKSVLDEFANSNIKVI